MTKRYVIRYVKTSYLEVIVEAESMANAREKANSHKTEFDDTYHDCYNAVTYPSREDMICRINEKGQRANVPLDDDDQEIEQVDEKDWGRGE